MTKVKVASEVPEVKQFFTENKDFLKELVQNSVQEIMNAEMSNYLNADAYERTGERKGYRAGYYSRFLYTRVGAITLRVPQDRDGGFKTEIFGDFYLSGGMFNQPGATITKMGDRDKAREIATISNLIVGIVSLNEAALAPLFQQALMERWTPDQLNQAINKLAQE